MSSEDSLEDIGLMRPDYDESIHDQSGVLTYSDLHSSKQSLATTSTGSTDEVMRQLELELVWERRDEIIASLSRHTQLLSGQVVNADARKKLQKENVDLVAKLMELPLKSANAAPSSSRQSNERTNGPNLMVLDLTCEARSRIVYTLMTNHQIALQSPNSVSSELKLKLIEQNNELACELLKLRSRAVAIPDDSSKGMLPEQKRSLLNLPIDQ